MTFKEKLKQEYPESIIEECEGACYLCPYSYRYETKKQSQVNCKRNGGKGCEYCWNREIEEDMKKEFTKADLKNGMVVETRNGSRYLFLNERFISKNECMRARTFLDNLCANGTLRQNDIMKVFETSGHSFETIFGNANITLIWERKKTECMTAEEMAAKLQELTGKEIEIKPSRNEMYGVLKIYCDKTNCCNCAIPEECGYSKSKGVYEWTDKELETVYNKLPEAAKK